jgi:hypothetical protein
LPWRKKWPNLRINRATTKSNQLSWKIIHNTVYTEAKLQKMGRSMNDLCHFCNTQVETLKHLFYNCSHTTKLGKNHIGVKKLHELS